MDVADQVFRREAPRMVAALTRIFGVHNLALAEDVVQDAFLKALEVWKTQSVAENPAAWLMTAARNRALDIVRRERTARTFAPEMGRLLESEWTTTSIVDEAFAEETVRDEQLRMMFSCCHPRLSEEVQVALILNILCGFSTHEIAEAFLAEDGAVEKRIQRGKKTLAESGRLFTLSGTDYQDRLDAVRRALYLLFSEGYHGSGDTAVRAELCREAIRLTSLLQQYAAAATPTTAALAALMHLHAARLPARTDALGDLHAFSDQDRSRWDAGLVTRGLALFEQSAAGTEVSPYHIEAAIAVAHASGASVAATDWTQIVELYDRLMEIAPSPVVALNRAIAVAERDGPERGLAELNELNDQERLSDYPFYHAALGELALRSGRDAAAREHFAAALDVARNSAERRFLTDRLHTARP
jgi:RNA polymerase sigma-70 factor (ECF subfamily)